MPRPLADRASVALPRILTRAALLLAAPVLLATAASPARGEVDPGNVVLPLPRFEELLAASQDDGPGEPPPPVPASVSDAAVDLVVEEDGARVSARLTVEVLAEGWASVRLLPQGAAIESLSAEGGDGDEGGTAWSVRDGWTTLHLEGRGRRAVSLRYAVPVQEGGATRRLDLPLPEGTRRLTARIPGTGWRVLVLPGTSVRRRESGGTTVVEAVLPAAERVQVAWERREGADFVVTRSRHRLRVEGDSVFAEATHVVDVASDEPVDVPLVSSGYALSEATVDGEPARVVLEGPRHAVTLQGRGTRRVEVAFGLTVERRDGQPAIELDVPVVPISSFELTLPGQRTVSVEPDVPTRVSSDESETRVTAWVPKTDHVRFAWTESRPVPEQDVRVNVDAWHLLSAERSGLRGRARFAFDVISGKARTLVFAVPDEVVIYEVAGDGVSDWRVSRDEESGARILSVWLDAPRHGRWSLDVAFDRLVARERIDEGEPVRLPLLEPENVHRHQGAVLLLSSDELSFDPVGVEGLSRVGAEVLPADLRSELTSQVAHGFRHVGEAPELSAVLREVEKDPARWDVAFATLWTLEEGALRGEVGADVTVKAGLVDRLVVEVPPELTVLDVVAPSLVSWQRTDEAGARVLELSFAEGLSGLVRLGITLERILTPQAREVALPPLLVRGSDVQRGHVALQSGAPVEVEGRPGEGVRAVTPDELPRSLTAASTDPILLAYEHAHVPYELAVGLRRHDVLPTLEARALAAALETRLEPQGNVVTRARWRVENRGRQLLRVTLPEGAEPWSAVVGNERVRPARDDEGRIVLPLPRAAGSVDVRLEYAEQRSPLGLFGTVVFRAPRVDVVVSGLEWSLALPPGHAWGRPDTDMTLVTTEENGGTRVVLRRELLAPGDPFPEAAFRHRRVLRAAALLTAGTALASLLLGVLLVRRRPTWVERAPAIALAALLVAAVSLGASPLAAILPLVLVLVTGHLLAPPARRAEA